MKEEIHYCVDCKHIQNEIIGNYAIAPACKAILSVVTKQPCECELARDGYDKCKKYEPANPKEGS